MKNIIVCIVLLAAFMVSAEPLPSPDMQCQADMRYPLERVYKDVQSGVHPKIIEYMIQTDKLVGDAGRWVLIKSARALVQARENNFPVTQKEFVERGLLLCKEKPEEIKKPIPEPRIDNWSRQEKNI
jgi:hypothetical protein